MTAAGFLAALEPYRCAAEEAKLRRHVPADVPVLGVRMKHTFDTAKAFTAMPLDEVERLLDSPLYEARMGAVSILDFKTRAKRITAAERAALYELYLRRHDRIDLWDLVDRAAPRVIGGYLLDHPRDVLDELAAAGDPWRRRTAITATFWLVRHGETADALRIAERLLDDPEPLIHSSVGTALREVGKVDRRQLVAFLDRHAGAIPRAALRTAAGALDPAERERVLRR